MIDWAITHLPLRVLWQYKQKIRENGLLYQTLRWLVLGNGRFAVYFAQFHCNVVSDAATDCYIKFSSEALVWDSEIFMCKAVLYGKVGKWRKQNEKRK